MKVTLIKPAHERQMQDWYKRPIIGISYLAAVLEKNEVEVQLIDAYYSQLKLKDILEKVDEFLPDVVGITAMTNEIHRASEIVSAIKGRHKVPAIIGGPHATALPVRTLKEFPVFDYLISGEGEDAIVELVNYLSGRISSINSVSNLVFRRDNGEIVYSGKKGSYKQDLDSLPFPAYHHYYRAHDYLKLHDEWYPLFSSRGCPFECSFCMQVLGRKVRYRSPNNILEEIELAIRNYGATRFDFADEIFLFSNKRTHEILDYFIASKLNKRIQWCGLTRANYVNEELIKKAKAAGCVKLEMGIESGNNNILKKVNKQITIEKAKQAVETIQKVGIPLGTYFILGHPGETIETMNDTIDFAAKINTTTIAIGIMVPYPGTDIWKFAKEGKEGYKLLSEDWRDYDKHGGRALEFSNISHRRLKLLQFKGYFLFYVKNKRFGDLLKFLIAKWKGILAVLISFRNKRAL